MNEIITRDSSEIVAHEAGSIAVSETMEMLQFLERAARDPQVDVGKMTALIDLKERMIARQAEQEFNQAYIAMMDEMPRIKKNKDVVIKEQKQYSYATWDSIFDQIGPVLQKFGFSLSFNTAPRTGEGGGMIITGSLLHKGGHKRDASIPLALENSGSKNNVQGMGSTFSYGKRYTTTMLLNLLVVDDDDDGLAGGTAYLTPKHKEDLVELLKQSGGDTVQFLRYFGVNSIDELQEANYLPARNMLEQKIAQRQRKQT